MKFEFSHKNFRLGIISKTNHYDLNEADIPPDVVVDAGAVTKYLAMDQIIDLTNLQRYFSCQKDDAIKVFTRTTAPTRWHYGTSENSPNILLVANQGLEVCSLIPFCIMLKFALSLTKTTLRSCENGPKNSGVSEFDYVDSMVHTIFYAQGPSIKTAITLPSFQNVEYMNLWFELLNLRHVANNGSVGFMRQILSEPNTDNERTKFGIRTKNSSSECPFTNEGLLINCGGCSQLEQVRIAKWMNSCTEPRRLLVLLSSSSSSFCYQKYCEKLIITETVKGFLN
ncbi:hypothetical protein DICVIV_03671 [Dictyocaulus viviparus]|uniref:Uncharacterized protein n=1 Tax=Dictyocaulus viviparus TaxID=29172 RepID=A0A0D8XZR6_DICVI|nr:hypothetical protein DICVIV_03671 [Dictyocaulus viviparus]